MPFVNRTRQTCSYQCKDTNLKAIHNLDEVQITDDFLVLTNAKILIWKQFTTIASWHNTHSACSYQCKDTNLKAIHNRSACGTPRKPCSYQCKDTNLKAIHNLASDSLIMDTLVLTNAKILIWKQFTTFCILYIKNCDLFLPMQRY